MSRDSRASHNASSVGHPTESGSQTSHYTSSQASKSARSTMSSRCSQIQSELDAVNAELASLRAGRESGAESVVSATSDASSLRPQDSISSVSSRRGSTKPRSSGSELRNPSTHTSRSSRSASGCRRSYAPSTPSSLSRVNEQPSQQGSEPSKYSARSSHVSSRYQPTLSGTSTALSGRSRPPLYGDSGSSVSGTQYSGTIYERPSTSSYHQPSLTRREDGSYYDTKLKVSIEVEERSPDMYGCVNNGLRLDGDGNYDVEDSASYWARH